MHLDVVVDPSQHPDEKSIVGLALRGVTRTLREAGMMSDWQVSEEILQRGSDVHKACHYRLQKDLDLRTLPRSLRGYVRALELFLRETRFAVEKTEFPVENIRYGVRGKLDVLGTFPISSLDSMAPVRPATRTIIELKTGEPQPFARLQLAAYGFCLDETGIFRRIALRLFGDGTYDVKTEYPLAEYFPDVHTFLACNQVTAFKRRFGL